MNSLPHCWMSGWRARIAAMSLFLGAVAPATHAQIADSLVTGTRIRVTTPTATELVATILQVRGDTLVLRSDNGLISILKQDITRVDASHGRPFDAWKGERVGMVVGALSGAYVGNIHYRPDECEPVTTVCRNEDMIRRGAAYAAIGFVVGGVVGASMKERWSPIATTVGMTGSAHRFGLTLRI